MCARTEFECLPLHKMVLQEKLRSACTLVQPEQTSLLLYKNNNSVQ